MFVWWKIIVNQQRQADVRVCMVLASLINSPHVFVCCRFRWQLRFMVYSLQHRLSRSQATNEPATHYIYDIFVSYDSSDSQWVVQTLLPELEGRRGLRLCLHERDFTPGASGCFYS